MDGNSIRDKISALEEEIKEYHRCIEDLKTIETSLQNKMQSFDSEVCSCIDNYDISSNESWVGKRCDEAISQLEIHKKSLTNLEDDLEALNQDIVSTIVTYEDMISSCEDKIRSLYEELEVNQV